MAPHPVPAAAIADDLPQLRDPFTEAISNDIVLGKIESSHCTARVTREELEGQVGAGEDSSGGRAEGSQSIRHNAMPGVVKSDGDPQAWSGYDTTQPNPDPDGTDASYKDSGKNDENSTHPMSKINGSYEELSDQASYVNGASESLPISHTARPRPTEDISEQNPPEIQHITFGYLPFSALITRLVQDTFNSLNDMVNDMADLPMPLINGVGGSNLSQTNIQKKITMLSFCQERRAQLIKVLVLSQWSRQAESISKVIDMRVWLDGQRRLYDDACLWMGELKRILGPVKVPNTDLQSALEPLSLGTASWLPDLGYIPEESSPQQLLDIFRTINTQLAIRLNLYERLPVLFRGYSIKNGRVTFRIPEEFEVDLSIADEDHSSQFFFIDLRFLFLPTSNLLLEGWLRDEIEGRINHVLCHEGLEGCSQFLHEFVLSHKLNILKEQAYQLSVESWSNSIRVEAIHRSLVIHYWLDQPGPRNWIEIGMQRQRTRHKSWLSGNGISCIAIRWFRAGREVKNARINIDPGSLSVEAILRRVISNHTDLIFRDMYANLSFGAIYSKRARRLKHVSNASGPMGSSLLVQLTESQTITITQEPVSGKFAISPASLLNMRAERDLSNLAFPSSDAASRIAKLRASLSQDELDVQARYLGWEIIASLRPSKETIQRLFRHETLRIAFYRRKSWQSGWFLVCTFGLMGDRWWILRSAEGRMIPENALTVGPELETAFEIPVTDSKALVFEPSIAMLSRIEGIASGMISQYMDTHLLAKQNIRHQLCAAATSRPVLKAPTLRIMIPDFRIRALLDSPVPLVTPWANKIIRLIFIGIDRATSSAVHIAVAKTKANVPGIKSLASTTDSSVTSHPTSGALAFRLTNRVGLSTIPSLLQRLSKIERLLRNLSIVQKHGCACNDVSLDHLSFTYADSPSHLKARISSSPEKPPRLSFNHGNPHLRIQDKLVSLMQATQDLDRVIMLLHLTHPVMVAYSNLVATHTNDKITLLPRSALWFQVRYEKSKGHFDLKLRKRRGTFVWFAHHLEFPRNQSHTEDAEIALRELAQSRGDGWHSMRGGFVASLDGTRAMLAKLDEVVGNVGDVESVPMSSPRGKKRKAQDTDVVLIE
ncbi:MAG: hypothetical protein Q9167_001881 [Letrouitia subvulpina]